MASIKFIRRNKKLKDGTFPVVLRIVKNRRKKLISTGFSCKENEFDNQEFKKNHPNYLKRNRVLNQLKNRAYQIIDEFKLEGVDFTLDDFENEFRGLSKKTLAVKDFFEEIISEMERSGRIGNAKAYTETFKSLFKYARDSLTFSQITPEFLEKYEVWLRENGNKEGGIAFKMRELRAIYNKAINRGIVGQEYYPFKKYKISKLKAKQRKIALSIEDFKRIKNFNVCNYPELIEAYNYFMFSFYANGMNFIDMAKLKWSDIRNGRIYYQRSKTKGKFSILVNSELKSILEYYQGVNRSSDYIFPILLKNDLTPKQIAYRKHKVLSRYNRKLRSIAKLVGISTDITSYVARHSFATILKHKGTSIEKISELMGHADVQITMTYLKEFEQDDLDKETAKLLDL